MHILRGILEQTTTADLARQLGCQRAQLVSVRRRLTPLAHAWAESIKKPPEGENDVSKPVA
jgi:hypothetical protein